MKKKIVVFKREYNLSGLNIFPGDEFVVGPGRGELAMDSDGYLILFSGEFSPHRVHPGNFDVRDVEVEK
jgi:hypothetical protein